MLLSSTDERRLGCDATIIVESNNQIKIAVFEAKWPRLAKSYYNWDYAQTASGLSHFSDQLTRQKRQAGRLAIFEMFYCEYLPNKQPAYMQNDGSSCIWHDDAYLFNTQRNNPDAIWSQNDIKKLLKLGNISIGTVVSELCKCNVGEPMDKWGEPEDIAKEFSLPSDILYISTNEAE